MKLMKAPAVQSLLENNPSMLVLHVSNPIDGDSFAFGTREELENEFEGYVEHAEIDEVVTLTMASHLANALDFEAYGDQDIKVYQ